MRHTHTSHFFFFFNDTAPTEIYPLSLHDALPISLRASRIPRAPCRAASRRARPRRGAGDRLRAPAARDAPVHERGEDRKRTRLKSSHVRISVAVFCFEKKKTMTGTAPCACKGSRA